MGTKIHSKSHIPGYYTMRDLNEDSSSSSWLFCYKDKPITNGHYYNTCSPKATLNDNPRHGNDALKQKMLDHETVFKNQVSELHRLYRIQRDMMDEVGKKEPHMGSTNGVKSVSRIETVDYPLSCTKGYNSTQPGFVALDSRPLKMRKKLFDLQLPADEYIDTDEEEDKLNPISFADLNEPFSTEVNKGINRHYKSNTGYLGDGFLMNSYLESKVNETGRFSNTYEAGCSKINLGSSSRGQHDKLPIPHQGKLNSINHPFEMYQTGYNGREGHWREGNHHGLQSYHKNRDHSNNGHLEPLLASQARPGSYSFFSSSCFDTSRAQSVSSWAKPTSSFTQKVSPFEPSLNSAVAIDRNLMNSAHSQEPFGGKWLVNASSRSNPGSGSILTTMNGFHHGSASGSKDLQVHLPSSGFGDLAPDRLTNHGSMNFSRGPCRSSSKPVIDINLNEADIIIIDEEDTKHEEHLSVLPWLKRGPARDKETIRDLNQPFTPEMTFSSLDCEPVSKKGNCETQNVKKILGFPIFEVKNEPISLVSTDESVGCSFGGQNFNKDRKRRIIDINLECEPDEHIAAEEPLKGMYSRENFDLNSCVSDCEDPSIPSYESKICSIKTTFEIDLEAPARFESEDENIPSKKLELLQSKDDITRDENESLRDAAEAIFAMSSSSCPKPDTEEKILHPTESSLAESLLWFVDAISSCANKSTQKMESFLMDDFEAMTLQIQDTKKEDYMPIPFVPEFEKFEDVGGNTLPTRGRRGHSRRGRQRRDFQRDVLPGLTTLSRHEVTEDIQTFAGLMRAMGHHWSSGLTRRNGLKGTRGRKRVVVENPVCSPSLVKKVNKIEGVLEDKSLIGWGKTTRRPRRQRCPSGNIPTTVVST